MATLSVTADVKKAASSLKRYQRKKVPTASKRAINKALRGGRTDTKKVLSKRISMTQRKIGERIKLQFATNKAKGTLQVVGPRKGKEFSNLGSFNVKPPEKSIRGKRRVKGKGVRAKVWGGRKAQVYRGTFAWTRPGKTGDAVTVFKRSRGAPKVAPGKRAGRNSDGTTGVRKIKRGPRKGRVILRQPITPVYGASLKREFTRSNRRGQKRAIDLVRASMRVRFIKEFERLLGRL